MQAGNGLSGDDSFVDGSRVRVSGFLVVDIPWV